MIPQLAILAGVVICLSASTTTKAAVAKNDPAKALRTLQNVVSHIYGDEKFDDDIYKIGKTYDLKASAKKYDAKYQLTVKKGENTFQETVNLTSGGTIYDFPKHLIFPKGKVEGLPVQFFVHVSKFDESQHRDQQANLLIRDNKPLRYPLDRPLFDFSMPNLAVLDSTIDHEE